MTERVFIVEDEIDLIAPLEFALRREGYDVEYATSAEEAWPRLEASPSPNILLLDLMLPGQSGLELCRMIRGSDHLKTTPIIMVTAKGEEIDRVLGFEMGVDDYVVKPYSVRELTLRIRAQLRRSPANATLGERRQFGVLSIDSGAHSATVAGNEIKLTALEFRLLEIFLERKGRVQTRNVLLNDVWEMHADVTTRTVDTHVKRLRQKLGPAADYIETIRGVGYRFVGVPPEHSTQS